MWKSVLGSDGVYEVSDCGLVRRLGKWGGEIVSRVEKHTGYVVVSLRIGGVRKPYYVHRLVAQAFIPNPGDKKTVNHLDGNKLNNAVSNLEWATQQEQIKHSVEVLGNTTAVPVDCFDKKTGEFIRRFDSVKSALEFTGMKSINICDCCTGKRKSAGGYVWRYADAVRG
jgi:hypothetical protein